MSSGDYIHTVEDYERQKSSGAIKKSSAILDTQSEGDANTEGKLSIADNDLASGIGRSTYGRSKADAERKIGHRRVGEGGEITYKKIQTTQIMGAIQLGIQHTVGSLASKPRRDLLMMDFWEIETISFPPEGSSMTPAHHFSEFRFKIYAPIAFRYFRDLFGIQPDDFMMSMCSQPLRELSNPGASGSIFYLTSDDEFIIKTVQHKEGEFLQKLLPGYYMNLNQNPRTLLPKFFGLYCYQCNSKNVRLIAMNNLLPSYVKMHEKYDLKGSTYKRKASKSERTKPSPTYKDLDFMEIHPNGILLEADTYNALIRTIQRDCRVLESFKIMDYSLLVGIHNLDIAFKERQEQKDASKQSQYDNESDLEDAPEADQFIAQERERDKISGLNRSRSINRQRLVAHSTAMESIQAESEPIDDEDDVPPGGIPARSEKGERLLLFIGLIDILQSYRLKKKLEHTFKSIIHDGDTVSVHRPSFYATRFQDFMAKTVFKKIQSPLKQSPSKRKSMSRIGQRASIDSTSRSNGSSNVKQTVLNKSQQPTFSKTLTASQPSTYTQSKPKSNVVSVVSELNPLTTSGVTPEKISSLPPLKKKVITVKDTVPPPVPPRSSSPRVQTRGPRNMRFGDQMESQHLSTGSIPSTSSTPPPAFQDVSNHHEEYMTQYREMTISERTTTCQEDVVSVSDIHLEKNLEETTYPTRGALSWAYPPAVADGSTPTWTEGTPSFTDSSSAEELSSFSSPTTGNCNNNASADLPKERRNINSTGMSMETI